MADFDQSSHYGESLMAKEFLLTSGIVNFNHGSFGTVPRDVMNRHMELLMEQEGCPEVWFRETYFKYVNEGRKKIAELIHSAVDDVVLVENASTAVNAILRSFPFSAGDVVLIYSSAYRMVKETLLFLTSYKGIEMVEMPIPYPLPSEEALIDLFKSYLDRYQGRVKLSIFSHISSMPTIIEPIERLTKLAKTAGSQALIDGAHAPGVVDISVEKIGADYYTGNCHKWLYASKGCAFLWTSKDIYHNNNCNFDSHPQPVVISSTGKYDYLGRFEYTGTRDYVAFCALPACFTFIESKLGGLSSIRSYCQQLLSEGCQYLIQQWQTGYLVPLSMNGFMANVILPSQSREQLIGLRQWLLQSHRVIIVFESVPNSTGTEEIYFIRISSQVYLEMKHFHQLAALVLEYLSVNK